MTSSPWRLVLVVGLMATLVSPAASGHDKTDILTLDDGSRILGEIKSLTNGTLSFGTTAADTLSVEWYHVVTLESVFEYQIRVAGGDEYHGALAKPDQLGELKVVGGPQDHVLQISNIVMLYPIGKGFRKKVDGSLNSGFSYTQSNKAAQYSISLTARYRSLHHYITLSGSSIFNSQEGGEPASQHSLSLSPVQLLGTRWASFEIAQVQSNPDQGFDTRVVIGGGAARFLQMSPRRVTFLTMGPVANRESVVDSPDVDTSAEILVGLEYYRIRSSRRTPSINANLNTFTDISGPTRYRIQFTASLTWEIVRHFTFGFNLTDSYDSEPPGGDSMENDISLVSSIGYTF